MDQDINNVPVEKQNESSVGAAIGIILIIAVLITGAFYFWGRRLNKDSGQSTSTPESSTDAQSTTTVQ